MKTTAPPPSIQVVSSALETTLFTKTLVAAFHSDPAARWLFPDEELYTVAFERFVQAFAGPAFEQSTAHLLPDFSGAAAWFAPGIHGNDEAVIEVLEDAVPSDRLDDAFGVFEQMDRYHPTESHWYLPLIGVDPDQQGRGHGSRLLAHVLDECDRTQSIAYLEASSTTSVPLYQRHGFRLRGEIQTGSSPSLFPMIRNPQLPTYQP